MSTNIVADCHPHCDTYSACFETTPTVTLFTSDEEPAWLTLQLEAEALAAVLDTELDTESFPDLNLTDPASIERFLVHLNTHGFHGVVEHAHHR